MPPKFISKLPRPISKTQLAQGKPPQFISKLPRPIPKAQLAQKKLKMATLTPTTSTSPIQKRLEVPTLSLTTPEGYSVILSTELEARTVPTTIIWHSGDQKLPTIPYNFYIVAVCNTNSGEEPHAVDKARLWAPMSWFSERVDPRYKFKMARCTCAGRKKSKPLWRKLLKKGDVLPYDRTVWKAQRTESDITAVAAYN
ncbi:hypothetical protein BJ508DRAFT_302357 [Ascobolus immersus RN42]|uniref:Uncharacterized protein n=1 Tax=Ascobolus immersus RN42 TaxID=1160509 RepID=A0A3N4IMP9_ASCIM|nr:hypothetical protein BJ508DRAFT_302357 [Ascobolus immersus RN42]